MNIEKIKGGPLALLVLFNCFATLNAQTTKIFENGFVGLNGTSGFFDVSDSTISVTYAKSSGGQNLSSFEVVRCRKSDLSPMDTVVVWQNSGSISFGGFSFIKNSQDEFKYYLAYAKDAADILTLDVRQTNSSFAIGNSLFTLSWNDRELLGSLLVEGNFYFFSRTKYDSLHMDVYDTLGTKINGRTFTYWDSTRNQLPVADYLPPEIHPANDSLLVLPLGVGSDNGVYLVDRFSLDTAKSLVLPPGYMFNRGYSTSFPAHFIAHKDYFAFAGTISKYRDISGPPVTVLQYYYFSRNWNNDSLELLDFGPEAVYNRAYAYTEEGPGGNHFLGGSVPFHVAPISGQEYRQVLIYRWNQFGTDSLLIFGNKNHVPSAIHASDDGDLFVCGNYSEAWSTDSNYVFLTKIPGYAIDMIEQKKMAPRLFLYPNPTTNHLKIEGWEKFQQGSFKIIDESGRLVRAGKLEESVLDIHQLASGSYIFLMEKDGETFNSVFMKQGF